MTDKHDPPPDWVKVEQTLQALRREARERWGDALPDGDLEGLMVVLRGKMERIGMSGAGRYTTWAQAEAGHREVLEEARRLMTARRLVDE